MERPAFHPSSHPNPAHPTHVEHPNQSLRGLEVGGARKFDCRGLVCPNIPKVWGAWWLEGWMVGGLMLAT
eukprot:8943085-Pyramimonas_sp.AAC.1